MKTTYKVGDKVKLAGTPFKGQPNPALTVEDTFADGELLQVSPADHLASNQLWVEDVVPV